MRYLTATNRVITATRTVEGTDTLVSRYGETLIGTVHWSHVSDRFVVLLDCGHWFTHERRNTATRRAVAHYENETREPGGWYT